MLTASERNYLLTNMEDLLYEYDYDYTRSALNDIIDAWKRQKAGLIEAFKKHPHYVEGKFMIAFDADYERGINTAASIVFKKWVINTAIPELEGKFPTEIQADGHLPYEIRQFFVYLDHCAERCVSESTANYINSICPAVHAHAGQKTSRVVNKLCCYLGLDKVDGYNREFAKYADSLSPMTIKRHTVLSINPLDYLTMSFGNSWASCHTIDKKNKRCMPNDYSGCYSSGTISYMLDSSSMVLYTVDAAYDGDEYWEQPKINRQMFHYGEDKLVQGRLYPQDNDGNNDVYTPYRNIVQSIISSIFDFPNLWTLNKGTEYASKYISSRGTHYRDYQYYSGCSLSRIKGSENENSFIVGARPICVHCGCTHNHEDNINCCGKIYCEQCGDYIDEEDAIYIDGYYYCRDCVNYCDYCEEYHLGSETYVDGYGYICESCLENDFIYCEECHNYVRDDYATYVEYTDRYVCDDCLSRHYTQCAECEEYYPDDCMEEYEGLQLCESCYENRTENADEVC